MTQQLGAENEHVAKTVAALDALQRQSAAAIDILNRVPDARARLHEAQQAMRVAGVYCETVLAIVDRTGKSLSDLTHKDVEHALRLGSEYAAAEDAQ